MKGELTAMWPDLKETPIEDYEYALAGENPPAPRAYRRIALPPGVLIGLVAGAFALGACVGWRLAESDD